MMMCYYLHHMLHAGGESIVSFTFLINSLGSNTVLEIFLFCQSHSQVSYLSLNTICKDVNLPIFGMDGFGNSQSNLTFINNSLQ